MTDQDIDAILGAAKLPEVEVRICLRTDLLQAYDRIEDDRPTDSLSDGGVAARREAMKGEIEAATVTFTLRALPREKFRSLLNQHPPRKDNRADQSLGYDIDGFTFALARKCTVEPSLTKDHWDRLEETLSQGQWNKLHRAALDVNQSSGDIPF